MLKKRIRASNFNGEEENILVKCVLRHGAIIENKKTDACTLREKQRAWEEIGNEFNSLCPNVTRQIKALKDKYTNLKTMLRKQSAAEKANQKAIGGDKEIADWRPRNEAMAELAKLISNSTQNGTSPTFDHDDVEDNYESHDAAVFPSVESDIDEKPFDLINLQTGEALHNNTYENVRNVTFPPKISQSSTSKSWSKYTPTILRKQNKFKQKRLASGALSSRSSNMENSLQSLKRKLIERTLEMREIEHRTRLKHHQREHEARMALLEARRMDFETKVKLRQFKTAELTNERNIKTEIDFE